MKNSMEIQRKQTTSYGDYSQEVKLETGDNGKVHSISTALESGRNDEYSPNISALYINDNDGIRDLHQLPNLKEKNYIGCKL